MVSLWQNNTRGNRVETPIGGRGWMSKLIPHVPQEETFQAASAYSAGGRVVEYSKLWEHLAALSRTFHPHTAVHWIHMDPFSSTMASQGTIYFFWQAPELQKVTASEKPKGTLNRRGERNRVTSCSGKQNELYWSRIEMTHADKV